MVEQESLEDSVDNSVSVTRHKIIFVGDAGVGKTSIVGRIMDNPFKETYETSIGVDFCSKNIRYKGLSTKLQIWDSAGQERYKSLIPSYIRNSSIVFLVYDVSKKQTFKNIPEWISFIKKIEDSIIVLIGNKSDLTLPRIVPKELVEDYCKKNGIEYYFEASAKTGENVHEIFKNIVKNLFIRFAMPIINDNVSQNEEKEIVSPFRKNFFNDNKGVCFRNCFCYNQ